MNNNYNSPYKQDKMTFRDIVISAIELCRVEGSKEMTKGGQANVFSKEMNSWISVNVPDQTKVFQQTVEQLYNHLAYHFDKEAKDKIEQIRKDIDNSYLVHLKKYIEIEEWIPYKERAKKIGAIQTGKDSGIGVFYLSLYEAEVLKLYNKLQRELIFLFERVGELRTVQYGEHAADTDIEEEEDDNGN